MSRVYMRRVCSACRVVGIAIAFLTASAMCGPLAGPQDSGGGPDTLTVDQAVKIALANNRTLKIVSLNLDISKEKLAAAKTRRLPSFSIYTFASQLLSPISFDVPAGQFGTY